MVPSLYLELLEDWLMIMSSLYLVLVFDSWRFLCTWHWYLIRGVLSVPGVDGGWVDDSALSVPCTGV